MVSIPILFTISDNDFPKFNPIFETTLPIPLAIFLITSQKSLNPEIIPSKLKPLNTSPIAPPTLNIPSVNPARFPIRLTIPDANFLINVQPTFMIENNPLNTFFKFSACVSVNLKFFVKSLMFSVISKSFFDVIGGNTSINASLIGLMILKSPSKAFFKASMAISRPPPLAHPSSISLRA